MKCFVSLLSFEEEFLQQSCATTFTFRPMRVRDVSNTSSLEGWQHETKNQRGLSSFYY